MASSTKNDPDAGFSASQFYAEVIDVLTENLEKHPERQDLRLKLLEVHAASGHRETFATLAREYYNRMASGGGGDWTRVQALASALLLDDSDIPDSGADTDTGRARRFGEDHDDSELTQALQQLDRDYERVRANTEFLPKVDAAAAQLGGTIPPPLYHAERLAEANGGADIYIAREPSRNAIDRKLANALGQAHLAHERGRARLVAGSVTGGHAVATAAAAAHLDLECTIHMRRVDSERHAGRTALVKRLGADVRYLDYSVQPDFPETTPQAAAVLNEVREAAVAQWLTTPDRCQFVNGLAAGPEPFPAMLRDFHAQQGRTVRRQIIDKRRALAGAIVASLDGGLAALDLFVPFIGYGSTRLIGTPGGDRRTRESNATGRRHDATLRARYSDDQMEAADRILGAQGFPSTRREQAWLKATGRVYILESVPEGAREAIDQLARTEGLVVAAEAGAPLVAALAEARRRKPTDAVVVQLRTGPDLDFT